MLKKSRYPPLIDRDQSNKKSFPGASDWCFLCAKRDLGSSEPQKNAEMAFLDGGENRIRTCERLATLHAFQACSFNHSDTSPAPFILSHSPSLVISPKNLKHDQF